jgi:hypothetical protein
VAGDPLASGSATRQERERDGAGGSDDGADPGSRLGTPGVGWAGPRPVTPRLPRHTTDLLIAVALFVLALVTRHGSLPHDGLLFDDAWVAVGAMKAPVGELLTVGAHHPGFTGLLMGWAWLVPSRSEWLALPVYVVGASAAGVLYLVLRWLRVSRSGSLLVGAIVVVAPAHVYYSGRVKTYVIEGLLVLLLAVSLPLLARRRWTWSTVALWVGASVLVGTMSAFTLVAGATATVMLALHPAGDRVRRWAALGAQVVIQAGYLAIVQSRFDSAQVADHLERNYDAFIEPTADPGSMARQLGAHLARVGEAVVVVGRPLQLGITVVALAALGWEAWRGSRFLVARFLLALPTVAFVGSLIRQIPFGPTWGNPVFPGTRATLWLVPSLAVGLAFGLDLIAAVLRRVAPAAALPLSIGVVLFAGVVLALKLDDAPPYLNTGARSAHRFVEERLDDRDLIFVLASADWTYAAEPGVSVDTVPDSDADVGFRPRLVDPRVWAQSSPSAWDGSLGQLSRHLAGAPQVFIVNGFIGYGDQVVPRLEAALASLGYQERPGVEPSVFKVSVWDRGAG